MVDTQIKPTFTLYDNSDFEVGITLTNGDGTPFDLTDYTIIAWYKTNVVATDYIAFTCSKKDEVNGSFNMSMTTSTIAGITKNGVYDVILESSVRTIRILSGNIIFERGVTRP